MKRTALVGILVMIIGTVAIYFLSFFGLSVKAMLMTSISKTSNSELYANLLLILTICLFGLIAFIVSPFIWQKKEIKAETDHQPNEIKEANTKSPGANQSQEPSDKKFIYHNNLLWLSDDLDPYCPPCHEIDNKQIHAKFIESITGKWKYYECPRCHYKADLTEHPDFNKR